MRLYDDYLLVDCSFGEAHADNEGRMSIELFARYWTISHTWKGWAVKINEDLILN